jgi:hypothetical protein
LDLADEHEHFVARFDSLARARLYYPVSRAHIFTKTRFDERREEWTLTVENGEWESLAGVASKDLAAELYQAFREVRALAGSDPEKARMVLVSESGVELLACITPEREQSSPGPGSAPPLKPILIAVVLTSPVVALAVFKGRRKEILLALLSVVFSVLIAEISLRHFYPQVEDRERMFEYDSDLGWRFIPDRRNCIISAGKKHHYIDVNPSGFRDTALPLDQDVKKIMVLGDSFVSNVTVGAGQVFTEIMERRLPDTAVLNLGVNGYGQVQEYLLLNQWIDRVRPDMVMLVIYIRNDFDDNLGGYWLYPRPVAQWDEGYSDLRLVPPPPMAASDGNLIDDVTALCGRSHFYCLVDEGLDVLIQRLARRSESEYSASVNTPPELYLCRKEPTRRKRLLFRTMEALLLKIARCVEARSVPIVFVIAPSFLQADVDLWSSALQDYGESRGDYIRSLPNRELMRFAKERNLAMIDLLPVLERESNNDKQVYDPQEQHWTAEGNRIVADVLVEYIRSRPH